MKTKEPHGLTNRGETKAAIWSPSSEMVTELVGGRASMRNKVSLPVEDLSYQCLVRKKTFCAAQHDHSFGHRRGCWVYSLMNLNLNIVPCE